MFIILGTWNETCFFSKLPVEKGEDIVVFLLQQKDIGGLYLNSSLEDISKLTKPSTFKPVSMALKGTYGGNSDLIIDEKDSDYNNYILDNFKSNHSRHEISSNKEILQLFNVGTVGFDSSGCKYEKVFMKKSVYDKMVSLAKYNIEPFYKPCGFGEYDSFYESAEKLLEKHFDNLNMSEENQIDNSDTFLTLYEESNIVKFFNVIDFDKETSKVLQKSFLDFTVLNSLMVKINTAWLLPNVTRKHTYDWHLSLQINEEMATILKSEVDTKFKESLTENFGLNPYTLSEHNPEKYSSFLKAMDLDILERACVISEVD